MTEVDYGGGGHRTRLREIDDQLVCLWGAPSPVYKGVEEGEGRPSHGAPNGTTRENPSSSVGLMPTSSAGYRATNKALQLLLSSSVCDTCYC